jgi:hypothetical protein
LSAGTREYEKETQDVIHCVLHFSILVQVLDGTHPVDDLEVDVAVVFGGEVGVAGHHPAAVSDEGPGGIGVQRVGAPLSLPVHHSPVFAQDSLRDVRLREAYSAPPILALVALSARAVQPASRDLQVKRWNVEPLVKRAKFGVVMRLRDLRVDSLKPLEYVFSISRTKIYV